MATASAPQPELDDRHERDTRDRALFKAWHEGDRRAGDRLYRLYSPRVLRYFSNRTQEQQGELTQETFLRLFGNYKNFKGGSFRSFLFGITRNVFFEFLRRHYRRRNIEPWTDSLAKITKTSITSQLVKREDHLLLLDALGKLPLDDLDLLDLYYWQSFSAREVGEVFECKEATIRSRLGAARKRLRQAFAEVSGPPRTELPSLEEIEAGLTELRGILTRSKQRKKKSDD